MDGRTDGPGMRDADGRTEAWPRTPERREQPPVVSGRQDQFAADRGREPQFPGREDQFAAERGREPQFPGREQQFPGGAQQGPGGQEEAWWDGPAGEPGKPAEAAEKPKRSRWGRSKDKDAGKGKAPEVPAADDWAAGEPGDRSGWATESTSRWDRNAPRDVPGGEPGRRGQSGQPGQGQPGQGGPSQGGPGQAGFGQGGLGYAGQPSQGGPGYADRPNQGGPNPTGQPGQGEPNFGGQPGQAGPGFGGPSGQGERTERPGRGQDDWGGPGRSERGGQERVPEQRNREAGAFEDLAPLELNLDEEPKEKSSRRFLRRK
ncbi:hypothetical protein [Dactylosporangium darangshiense]|uniref:hypothetical protein n=1 Tax=Dactylosporangium darangshiense TaxID=579108 RepID=UPI003631D7AD